MIALIPARSGSKRIPEKNIKDFFGHPLLAYTVRAAIDSGVFEKVYVSSESQQYLVIAERYGAKSIWRPQEYAQDLSTDYGWVCHAISQARAEYRFIDENEGLGMVYKDIDSFAILRPTNPFRIAETIRRAYQTFLDCGMPSLRGMEKCKQHPHKMWRWLENKSGVITNSCAGGNFHNMPYQSLCEVFIQNASMDMGKVEVLEGGSIAGNRVYPFFTEGYEGFDLNTMEDWILAEELVKRGLAKLPEIPLPLSQTNSYLRDKEKARKMFERTIESSSKIER